MKAAVCPAYGPPEAVRVEELPAPDLADGQVRVQVRAAAVNFPDVLLIAGRYQVKVPPPFVPGSEFAGVITETCGETAGFTVGDRVTGTALFGAFAEQVCLGTAGLAHIPGGVDDRSAAASGVALRTAYHALRSAARVTAGDEVVVLGAGGGVGLAAVALATAVGARVTAVASSPEKLAVAAEYGAVHGIEHRRPLPPPLRSPRDLPPPLRSPLDLPPSLRSPQDALRQALREVLPGGAGAVIDPVGGELSEPALRSLSRGGRFVTIGFASGTIPHIPLNLVLVKGVQVLGFQFQDIPADEFTRNETELHELLTSGAVRPHIGATYPLADTAAALRHVADGRAIGKVVIDLPSSVVTPTLHSRRLP